MAMEMMTGFRMGLFRCRIFAVRAFSWDGAGCGPLLLPVDLRPGSVEVSTDGVGVRAARYGRFCAIGRVLAEGEQGWEGVVTSILPLITPLRVGNDLGNECVF
jgi:hypothetical protein